MPTTWSPDRQAEVGDHFGHPQGVQVKALNSEYGEGFDTGPPQVGAGFLSFCGFSSLFVVPFLGLAAGFPTLPALF